MAEKLQLFHAIADRGSARVRNFIADHELLDRMRYRNVIYPEVLADLQGHGGSAESVPALWDGEKLHVGADAIIAVLSLDNKI